jgi:hypothetical protein
MTVDIDACRWRHALAESASLRSQLRQRFSGRDEIQRNAVVTPPLSGRGRPIVEHVALVAAATDAVVLGSRDDQLEISFGFQPAGH